ncbi:hypothetical protein Tdes44962_MAKER03157 [Teratosphaeria destructans]|uniref:Uncharacterized protein n=1 Tax=Teratosphaeria destructans TaxID=418781 RepID=A0A9W7W252_9PEZI|nr:hypothetical protein Tdes44962_MAKER03157 [Teratosphaeria destructans]
MPYSVSRDEGTLWERVAPYAGLMQAPRSWQFPKEPYIGAGSTGGDVKPYCPSRPISLLSLSTSTDRLLARSSEFSASLFARTT